MHVFVVLRIIIIKDKLKKNLYVMRTIITFIMFVAAAYAPWHKTGHRTGSSARRREN